MANKTGKDVSFQIDDAAASIADITPHVNAASIAAALAVLEDSALGDDERTYLPGLAGATMSISGFWNSTTEAIFGPLIGNRTSITKTAEYGDGVRYYNGEFYVGNVQVSGAVDTLETFSVDLTATGAINRTSVQLS